MSALLEHYSSSTQTDVSEVLQSIANASPFAVDEPTRAQLIQILLDDVNKCKSSGSDGKISPKDAVLALGAIKSLGKHPSGASVLASPDNLSTLLSLSRTFKDDLDASCEALRCIANTMLLIEDARKTWISDSVKGGEASVRLLEKSSNPDQLFLASRILFLATVSSQSAGHFIISLIDEKHSGRSNVVEIISLRLDSLTSSILGGVKMAREAMTDLLKFTFNLLSYYPKLVDCEKVADLGAGEGKVMGEYWSDKLDGIVPPLLRAFNTLPPTFPSPLTAPLTHIIHSLIATPITANLKPFWFPTISPPSGRRSTVHSNSESPVLANDSRLPSSSGSGESSSSPKEAKPGALDRALSMLAAGRRSLSSRPSSPSPPNSVADSLQRAYDLLEVSFSHYLPGTIDPDDAEVRQRPKQESDSTLDDLLCPLIMLIIKCCLADAGAKSRLREWVLPANLSRSSALEGRADLLGRCLRLLTSVHHPRLKDATGEMLFAICDSDPSTLASQVGYGNVAGFLFNKGIMNAPPRPAGDDAPATDASINPITGVVEGERQDIEMTDEEKEQEAEKLFVLFDRLERSGALPPSQNPIRKAMQSQQP